MSETEDVIIVRRVSPVVRCSHCACRQAAGVRMIAGRRAYICEPCVRRAVDLLDAPEDITRFLTRWDPDSA